nr:hypothetical protein [Tanacetum cinerariifolium]
MRIEQYFLMTDYLSWEVILNGDSPIPTRVVEDAKTPMEAIEKRFRGNTVTKKVHKTLLKQQYVNFIVSAAASVSAVCTKMPVSSLPNVDSLKRNILQGSVGLPRIQEGMVLLSYKEEEEPANYALMAFSS